MVTIITITRMPTTERHLCRLLAWLSPAFPVGGFSYSHAIERAVDIGAVRDRATLTEYVVAVLELGAGRIDAQLFCQTWGAVIEADRAAFVDVLSRAEAMRGTSELALESTAQGAAFLAAVRAAWPETGIAAWVDIVAAERRAASYPVAVALASALSGIALEIALTAYLHAFVAGLVAAGVKLIPLGQTDGQRIIAFLEPRVAAAAAVAQLRQPEDLGSAAPMVDLWSMQHETQYTRLFRS